MANEAYISSNLKIAKGNIDYKSQPAGFYADVTGIMGPTPGAIEVSVAGTNVDLSELTTPALCRIQNLDSTNYVTFGIWDPDNSKFFPLGEILAGESYVLRLSRDLGWEFQTGTGTTGAETNTLRIRADTAACKVVVEAFEV